MNAQTIMIVAIANTIKAAALGTVKLMGPTHLARPNGSYVGDMVRLSFEQQHVMAAACLQALKWEEVTYDVRDQGMAWGQCRYFKAELSDLVVGYENIKLLSELTPEELKQVKVEVNGHHESFEGKGELCIEKGKFVQTKTVHAIVGSGNSPGERPDNDNMVIYTWYPGRLTKQVHIKPAHWDLTGEELLKLYPDATVKINEQL